MRQVPFLPGLYSADHDTNNYSLIWNSISTRDNQHNPRLTSTLREELRITRNHSPGLVYDYTTSEHRAGKELKDFEMIFFNLKNFKSRVRISSLN